MFYSFHLLRLWLTNVFIFLAGVSYYRVSVDCCRYTVGFNTENSNSFQYSWFVEDVNVLVQVQVCVFDIMTDSVSRSFVHHFIHPFHFDTTDGVWKIVGNCFFGSRQQPANNGKRQWIMRAIEIELPNFDSVLIVI